METETIQSINEPLDSPAKVLTELPYSLHQPRHRIISGWRKEWIEFRIRMNIVRIVIRHFKNPLRVYKLLKTLDAHRRKFLGESRIKKIAEVDGKYYWDLYIPSWPSKAFDQFMSAEINRIFPLKIKVNRFTNIYFGITKKCTLQCEHCYEWDALNGKEKLHLADLKSIVQKFQEKGTSQFQLSGGEPLLKMNDIIEILETSKRETEFWILTSGINLTFANALRLKNAGLSGVMISLDHFDPEKHDLFRGFKLAYLWAEQGVRNAQAAGLVTSLSICVTKSFVTPSNLITYAALAKNLKVSFIQILEPRAVGHYKGKDVSLGPLEEKILDDFYIKMNYDGNYADYPIVCYHGYYQRRTGCFASGNRSMYIDTDGDIHSCPFCQMKTGNALNGDIDQAIEQLQFKGCPNFNNALI